MKKNIHTKLNKYLENKPVIDGHEEYDYDLIHETRINDEEIFHYDVFVFGGGSGAGRMEHVKPYFHFVDHIKNPDKFKLSILIQTKSEWLQNHQLLIIENESTQINWSGLRTEKRDLIRWLDQPHKVMTDKTNYEAIRIIWNIENYENKNVRQV